MFSYENDDIKNVETESLEIIWRIRNMYIITIRQTLAKKLKKMEKYVENLDSVITTLEKEDEILNIKMLS